MAVPLLHEERALGVLEVLDRPQRSQFSLVEMDLLGLFANQAAIALDLLRRARRAEAVLAESGGGRGRRRPAGGDASRASRTSEREAGLKLLGRARGSPQTRRGRLAPPSKTRRSFFAAS